jgi:hypothetical protein
MTALAVYRRLLHLTKGYVPDSVKRRLVDMVPSQKLKKMVRQMLLDFVTPISKIPHFLYIKRLKLLMLCIQHHPKCFMISCEL